MKNLLFQAFYKKNIFFRSVVFLAFFSMFQSCATRHSQFGSKKPVEIKNNFERKNDIAHTFFLVGNSENSDQNECKEVMELLSNRLKKADTSSTLLFLGNKLPDGMPTANDESRDLAEKKVLAQIELSKNFKGNTVFVPGNRDWSNGVKGIVEQEKFVRTKIKDKRSFMPQNNCGIESFALNDNVAMIVINSQWFLEDWDLHPTINADCDIKTREQFFDELENKLKEFSSRTTILAMHHPLFSNGKHGGEYSLGDHIFPFEQKIPLPVVGTLINLFRKTSGLNPQDLQNKKYNAFAKRIRTLIQNQKNVVVVSAHDNSLQYIDKDQIKQIISGSASKSEAARAINDNDFSYGRNGYAVLEVLKDGASKVSFYGKDSKGAEGLLFKQQPTFSRPKPNLREYPNSFSKYKDTAVYTLKMTKKGGAYNFLWGKHYRDIYSTKIRANAATLDTLHGGLLPTVVGGTDDARILMLEDKKGNLYEMRALRKSATRFLQTELFKDQSIEEDFRETYAESLIMDFYTTSHPYTPFIVSKLADHVGINHTNPKLFYVPKQNKLALFNEDFGDELYLVEEFPMDGWKNLKSFGKPDKILTTEEVLANVRQDQKYEVDEASYIRARVFDMLVGDWDRETDQWSWGEHKENGKIIYRPIPRNRDHAFSKFDGALLPIVVNMPPLRHMRSFDKKIDNVKWFNRMAYPLDLAFVTKSDEKEWKKQTEFILKNLSDAEIDKAFELLPKEVKNATSEEIRTDLKARKKTLEKSVLKYYEDLQKTVLVVGTDKEDRFEIERTSSGTKVVVYSMKNNSEEIIHSRTYNPRQTKEIWVYGIDGNDTFEMKGSGRKNIKVRLLGGQGNDIYNIEEGKKVRLYDFASAENTVNNTGGAKKMFSDSYEINTYDYKKPDYNVFAGFPLLGFNPDDGVKIGARINYTVNGFNRFPYSQRHTIGGNYYFATSGFELLYRGVFPRQIGKWNFVIDALYTSPNFSENFFGFGNETVDTRREINLDYNRVKIRKLQATPSFQWTGEKGGSAILKASFERFEVDDTEGRFITEPGVVNADVFDYKNFANFSARYTFENYDNISNPTLGMTFTILGGYTINLKETDRKFPYAESSLGFTYKLSPTGNWMLASRVKGKAIFDDTYEFYQAATVGGDFDLRGFRNQRFSGKQSFFHSTDLRWNLGKIKNGFAPLQYGVFGGFDYGRVWLPGEDSTKWHQGYGGGIWLNGVNVITGQLSLFHSADGLRFSGGIGFGF